MNFENEGGATQLDNTSLAEYLEKIGASGWIRDYLEMICVTEFGLDAEQQSCLNLLKILSTDSEVELFGEHDERYQVKGGVQRITDELARQLDGQIHYSHRLEAIRSKANGFTLTFQGASVVRAIALCKYMNNKQLYFSNDSYIVNICEIFSRIL